MAGIQKLYTSLNIKMITTRNKDGRNMQREVDEKCLNDTAAGKGERKRTLRRYRRK